MVRSSHEIGHKPIPTIDKCVAITMFATQNILYLSVTFDYVLGLDHLSLTITLFNHGSNYEPAKVSRDTFYMSTNKANGE